MLLTPNMGIIIKYSRLTITITSKILRPNPHFPISGINNFFGIDFIISKKKIFFIDINPRITTSYKNINKNLRINIANKILNTL